MKITHLEIEKLKETKEKAKHLLSLLQIDNKEWQQQHAKLEVFMKSCKIDALITSAFVCYAGIFDYETRNRIIDKWIICLNNKQKSKSDDLPSIEIRSNFNFKDILFNQFESKEIVRDLNKLSLKDDYFIQNALILHEICSLPSQMSWPLIYDPEDNALKIITLMQESIENLKSKHHIELTYTSPLSGMSRIDLFDTTTTENNMDDLTLTNSNLDETEAASSSSALDKHSSMSRKSLTQMSEHSSVWEASNFCSRAHSANTVYHPKSSKHFLPSLLADFETSEMIIPAIEPDLINIPKSNLCLVDAIDPDLNFKLINAAVHGLTLFLKNSERCDEATNRLVQVLFERDFLYDSNLNKEYIKFGTQRIVINPKFKIVFQVNSPLHLSRRASNKHLFHRLTSQHNAAHSVVQFACSSNFVSTDLLNCVMELEKPGYSNQKYLLDKIVLDYEFNVFTRQVIYIYFIFSTQLSNLLFYRKK